jgi:uncharacterized protein
MPDTPQSQELRSESLKTESFTSNAHPIELFSEESTRNLEQLDFPIPSRYGIDTFVTLAPNVQTLFFYWELSAATMERFAHIQRHDKYEFTIKAYETVNSQPFELMSITVNGDLGNYYANYHLPRKRVYAIFGLVDIDGNFIELLRSNTVLIPSDEINLQHDEVWMRKKEEWMQLLRSSVHPVSVPESSLSLVREMEFLRKFQVVAMQLSSSSEMIKKDN